MKLIPSSLGAEKKKLAILGGLVVVLVAVLLINRMQDSGTPSAGSSGSSGSGTAPKPAQQSPLAQANRAIESVTPMPPQRTPRSADAVIQDFKPSLKPPEGTDVTRIDPTLHLELVAKLRTVGLEGGSRSIFDFGAPPPKDLPVVAPIKPGPIAPKQPTPAASATPAAPPKPATPAIPLKFYGYVDPSPGASRKAFFLQGDDIFVAGENDVVGNRYRILRINANSAIVEDTTTKNQQTLPLVEELPG